MKPDSHFSMRPIVFLLLVPLLLSSKAGLAHPMGNFSINHYTRITVGARSVDILYLLDFAEIPTYQDIRQYGLTPKVDDPSLEPYLSKQAEALRTGLSIESDGEPLRLQCVSRQVLFAEGAGGLPTMKIGLVFRGSLLASNGSASRKLTYADNNYSGHAGWKEVVVINEPGASILSSSVPATDRSQQLTNYPTDLLNSPPQQLTASVEFRTAASTPDNIVAKSVPNGLQTKNIATASSKTGEQAKPRLRSVSAQAARVLHAAGINEKRQGDAPASVAKAPAVSLRANAQKTPQNRFTQLISTQGSLDFWVLLSAALIAAGLGALHALEPGHGKTIVAAYLVGSRGTARHAVLLGFVVTGAHTAGVYLLGVVTLYASRYIVPEQLYPWLGAISGLTVAGLGIFMFLRHLTGQTGEHSHVSGEEHSHWLTSMFKRSGDADTAQPDRKPSDRPISLLQLCALGITGGIVPCPAALVVLLSAFSLHRIGFGLFLITAFSLGLAAVLVAVGLTMVYAKRFLSRVGSAGRLQRYLPLLSSAFMVVLGVGIAASAFTSAFSGGFGFVSRDRLIPFVTVILLGLFLGMRHSTDPDHVVAVSTIVSRQGSIKNSAAIGALWGLGHTLTIFLVGSAIIIFGVVIPPRLGLAMEFSVALMLILLGVLNLTGVMSWITARFTPEAKLVAVRTSSRGALDRTLGTLGAYQTFRPLVVGLVHGLAGSAAVALLVLSTIKSPFWATAYLLVFGLGTLAGMMTMTIAMSLPLVFASKRYRRTGRWITATSGLVSVAFGLFLVYQIGIVNGLFSSKPHWIPS
jgi:nickel/cobalt transporter (NicO) family protein